jgi:myo-inositol 2-dehydrogenase/D-chiro-inositol 1-dehydrogenase
MSSEIRLAIIGLGRLGMEYLRIVNTKCKNAQIVSACSLVAAELADAKKMGVVCYEKYEEMLEQGKFDAVLILSSSDLHPQHIIKALEAGYHVFSEKPLGTNLEDCLKAEAVHRRYPEKIAMVGFVRRFDASYLNAMEKVKSGVIGKPYYVRSQTVDHTSIAPFQLKFMKNSGSIYLDYNVHDIDLARWFLQSDFQEVYSIGGAYKYKEFADYNSTDNTISTCKMKNGTMAHILASRTCPHGHATTTEIWGSEGWLTIGTPANHIQVEWCNEQGSVREYVKTFFDRFEQAFQKQIEYFIDCVRENKQPELQLKDATQATKVALAMQKSFDKKKPATIL